MVVAGEAAEEEVMLTCGRLVICLDVVTDDTLQQCRLANASVSNNQDVYHHFLLLFLFLCLVLVCFLSSLKRLSLLLLARSHMSCRLCIYILLDLVPHHRDTGEVGDRDQTEATLLLLPPRSLFVREQECARLRCDMVRGEKKLL